MDFPDLLEIIKTLNPQQLRQVIKTSKESFPKPTPELLEKIEELAETWSERLSIEDILTDYKDNLMTYYKENIEEFTRSYNDFKQE